jgi:hypothetical protein
MLETLRNIINPDVKVRHHGKCLVLEEASEDSKLRKINFKLTSFNAGEGGELSQAVVINSDSNAQLYKLFTHFLNDTCPSINRKCDYIIFHLLNNNIRIILCELKSSELGARGRCHEQFEASKKFADYLVSMAKMYHECRPRENFIESNISVHRVVFLPMAPVAVSLPVTANKINTLEKQRNILADGTVHYVIPVNSARESTQNWHDFMRSIL